MLSVYISWPFEPGSTPVIDVKGSSTVGEMKDQVAGVLNVPVGAFTLHHEDDELEGGTVASLGLVEGCTVEARPSKVFEARMGLAELGLRCETDVFIRVVLRLKMYKDEEEQARIAQLMVDAQNGFDAAKALGAAAKGGHTEVVKVLAPVCDVNACAEPAFYQNVSPAFDDDTCYHVTSEPEEEITFASRTALHEAAAGGHLSVVRVLLLYSADPNRMSDIHRTPLHDAASRGDLVIARELLSHGADSCVQDILGRTALHEVAMNGSAEVAKCLLSQCVDIDKRDHVKGRTALHYACAGGHAMVVRELLQHGAEVDVLDRLGVAPFDHAADAVVGVLQAHQQSGESANRT